MAEIVKRVRAADEPLLSPEEEKMFNEVYDYAISLGRLYTDIDTADFMGIAQDAILQALKGYSVRTLPPEDLEGEELEKWYEKQRGKETNYYKPPLSKLRTLISRIIHNEVERFRVDRSKRRKKEISIEELSPTIENEDTLPIEDLIADLKEMKLEDVAHWSVLEEEIEDIFSEEDQMIVRLMIEGETYNGIKNKVNKETGRKNTLQRYLRHIKVNIVPKLKTLVEKPYKEVELEPELVPA